jgi:hypothetical protein
MNRTDFNYAVSIILLLAVSTTGITGFIQSQLDLHKFIPHTYTCYFTLFMTAVHISLKWSSVWRYLKKKMVTS